MKIDIQIKDNLKYAAVAFLVDREDFLKDIKEIREKLKITSLPYTFPKFLYRKANNVVNYYRKGVTSIYDVSEFFKDIAEEEGIAFADLDYKLAIGVMYSEILCRHYDKSRFYIPVMLSSLLVGTIGDSDFSSTTVLQIDKAFARKILNEYENEEETFAIQVSRDSTWKEAEDMFNAIQKYHLGTKKIKDNDPLKRIYGDSIFYKRVADIAPEIKRTREWYWRNKKGESYLEIALQVTKKRTNYQLAQEAEKHIRDFSEVEWTKHNNCLKYILSYKERVRKAVERYQKALLDI